MEEAGGGGPRRWVLGVEGSRGVGPQETWPQDVVSERQSDILHHGDNLLRRCLSYLVMLKVSVPEPCLVKRPLWVPWARR